jgi:diguanylate cyclase (GGDEF)-like protein
MGVGVSVTLTAVVVMLLRERLTSVIAQLAGASRTDYLTGLANRRSFDVELQSDIEQAYRDSLPLALVVFDLDHFKQINDRHGHAAGDEALREFAALLGRERRRDDTLARIGGEEFAVIMQGSDLDHGVRFAERIAASLRAKTEASRIALTTSAGVAALADSEPTASALLVAADRALYGAKAAGRRQVASWRRGTVHLEQPHQRTFASRTPVATSGAASASSAVS